MAVWSEADVTGLFGVARLDAEFYQPKFRENEMVLRSLPRVTTLGAIEDSMVKGIFDIRAGEYREEGVPFLRIGNLRDCLIETHDVAFISAERHEQDHRSALHKFDVVLSKTAYPAASLVQIAECNCSQDTIALRTTRSADFNIYLTVFLNTRPGMLQMQRLFQGNVQSHLSLNETRTILVPEPDRETLAAVTSAFREMMRLRILSIDLYSEAETRLFKELDLDFGTVDQEISYEHMFRDVAKAERLDAQFFQPKYQRALDLLGRDKKTIADIAPLAKRQFKPTEGASFEYIEIGDITADGRAESETVLGDEAPSRAQWIVQGGDVITSTVRPVRRLSALIEPDQSGFVCSSGFAVLEPRTVEPELLMVFLRLPMIAEILDLYTTATMYPAIPVVSLLQFPFSRPANAAVKEIVGNVRESRDARRESLRLLNEAKRAVEQMILVGKGHLAEPITE